MCNIRMPTRMCNGRKTGTQHSHTPSSSSSCATPPASPQRRGRLPAARARLVQASCNPHLLKQPVLWVGAVVPQQRARRPTAVGVGVEGRQVLQWVAQPSTRILQHSHTCRSAARTGRQRSGLVAEHTRISGASFCRCWLTLAHGMLSWLHHLVLSGPQAVGRPFTALSCR